MVIGPLAQRQSFQTANVEAVRQAQVVGEQIQREAVRKEAADQKLAEDESSVRGIPGAEHIRTEEHKGRGGSGAGESQEEAGEDSGEGEDQAGPAEKRLDFLA